MIAQSFNVRLVTHVERVERTFLKAAAATVFSLIQGPVAGWETDGRLQKGLVGRCGGLGRPLVTGNVSPDNQFHSL